MKRYMICLLLSLMLTVAVAAQDKPKVDVAKEDGKAAAGSAVALPTVDEVLDKYVKAIGGKEAIEKLKSRSIKGAFEIESMSITGGFESYQKAPDKWASIVNVPNMGTFSQVYDGAKGWDNDPMNGFRELSGAELAARKREADFYQEVNFKKNFAKIEVKGKDKVGSSDVYLVEATPADGAPEKLYFDVNTGLLVRQDSERESPQGKMPVEFYLDDYKVVDGVKIAHSLKQITPMFAMTLKFSEVKHNTEIDEKVFNKP